MKKISLVFAIVLFLSLRIFCEPFEFVSAEKSGAVAWSGDGTFIAAGVDGEVRLYPVGADGFPKKSDFVSVSGESTGNADVLSLKFTADGKWLLSVWSDGAVLVTNLDGSQRSGAMGGKGVRDAAFLGNAYSLAIPVDGGNVAEFFRLARTDKLWQRGGVSYGSPVRSVDVDSKASKMLVAAEDGFVREVKIEGTDAKWTEEGRVPYYKKSAVAPRFSPDGSSFLVAISDDEFAVIESSSRSVVSSAQLSGTLLSAAFSPSGDSVASGIAGGIVEKHRLSDGKIVWRTTEGKGNAVSLAFSPDGKKLLAALSDGRVVIFDTADEEDGKNPENAENNKIPDDEIDDEEGEIAEADENVPEKTKIVTVEVEKEAVSPENSLTFSVGFSSLGTDWYSLSTDFGVTYRNYFHYPLYFLVGGTAGRGTPSGDFPYTYSSGGESLGAPSIYSASTFGGAGLVYYREDWGVFAFAEISAGAALRFLWNNSFSSSHKTGPYSSMLVDFSGGGGWRWLRASIGVQYDTNIGFFLHGSVGVSIPMSALRRNRSKDSSDSSQKEAEESVENPENGEDEDNK